MKLEINEMLDLEKELENLIRNVENVDEVLKTGAEETVNYLKKLPKPISKIKKSGYTHLIDTFSYRKKGNEYEVCWGKYYGPFLENGTKKMRKREHFQPTFIKYEDKIIKKMIEKIYKE